jgi:GTPase Era involved in 16S rRNA processing
MLNIDPLDAQIGNQLLPYTKSIEISSGKLRSTDVPVIFIDTPGLLLEDGGQQWRKLCNDLNSLQNVCLYILVAKRGDKIEKKIFNEINTYCQKNSFSGNNLRIVITHCDMIATGTPTTSDEDGLLAFVEGLEYDWKEINDD